MQFSMCVMANIDEIDFFTHAENLGYTAVWVADSQMLFSDCYAVLALAAARTQRLRLGPGTARYCWPTSFQVRAVLFLVSVPSAFLPSKKACGTHTIRHFGVRQQYPEVL